MGPDGPRVRGGDDEVKDNDRGGEIKEGDGEPATRVNSPGGSTKTSKSRRLMSFVGRPPNIRFASP